MMNEIEFNRLFNDDAERVIGLGRADHAYHDGEMSWHDIRRRFFFLREKLLQTPHTHWILACDSTYFFMLGFLALVAAKKEILLPPNNLPGTLNDTIKQAQAVLTDKDINIRPGLENFIVQDLLCDVSAMEQVECSRVNIDVATQFIQICTSGSTGEPKQIRKSLLTLQSEINGLEKLWGKSVSGHCFVSTVSHQHIYGLLFRLLWPLMAGHQFVDENIEYPEQLELLAKQHGRLILISSPAYLKRMAEVLNPDIMQSHVDMIFSSGGPLAKDTAIFYTEHFKTTPTEVLGSTETGGVAYRQQQAEQDVAWQAFAAVQIRQQTENGALAVKSPYCFCEDWYEMGDGVQIISDSTFRLLARLDRIVKIEEKRVSLDRMEAFLAESGWVEQARITVLPGKRSILAAVCVLNESGRNLLAQLQRRAFADRLRDYLGHYFDRVSLPRKWRYVTDFPYNSQGKITQADLIKLFDEEQHD